MTRPDQADDGSAASFVRGLTIGALVGAAVAGSSLWSRRRRARKDRQPGTGREMAPVGDEAARSMGDRTTTGEADASDPSADPPARGHG